jgi:hypothetical protein
MRCVKCGKVSKNPYAENWTKWQMDYNCATIMHPEIYQTKQRKGTGGKYMKELGCYSMTEKIEA